MTLKENIMKLQTYKMFEGEDTLYVERDDVLKLLEQEQSGDLIQRQAVIDIIHRFFTEEVDKIPTKKTEDGEVIIICKAQPLFAMNKTLCKRIKELPSVNPQEPKTGHWSHDGSHWKNRFICSECGYKLFEEQTNYCPNCGAKMVEPQESEE